MQSASICLLLSLKYIDWREICAVHFFPSRFATQIQRRKLTPADDRNLVLVYKDYEDEDYYDEYEKADYKPKGTKKYEEFNISPLLIGLNTKLLFLILWGILLLPRAIEATLDLDSIRAQISALSDLVTTYYTDLASTLASITTTLATITTTLATISTQVTTNAATLTAIQTTVNSILALVGKK